MLQSIGYGCDVTLFFLVRIESVQTYDMYITALGSSTFSLRLAVGIVHGVVHETSGAATL